MKSIVVIVGVIIILQTMTIIVANPLLQSAEAYVNKELDFASERAPTVITGDTVYVVWWTDNTPGNDGEVMFRASTDDGATFTDKINLSNTTGIDSVDAEIAAEGATVIVTWWERNQTSDTPVARISTDAGETFGPMMMLGANGTISSTEE
jgi:hypothetical protein